MIEPKRSQTRLRGDLQLLQVCHIKADAHVDALLLKVGQRFPLRVRQSDNCLQCQRSQGQHGKLWLLPPSLASIGRVLDTLDCVKFGRLTEAAKPSGFLAGADRFGVPQ